MWCGVVCGVWYVVCDVMCDDECRMDEFFYYFEIVGTRILLLFSVTG